MCLISKDFSKLQVLHCIGIIFYTRSWFLLHKPSHQNTKSRPTDQSSTCYTPFLIAAILNFMGYFDTLRISLFHHSILLLIHLIIMLNWSINDLCLYLHARWIELGVISSRGRSIRRRISPLRCRINGRRIVLEGMVIGSLHRCVVSSCCSCCLL